VLRRKKVVEEWARKTVKNHPKCKRPKDSPYRRTQQCQCVYCSGLMNKMLKRQ
jgi:hypothetical protein